MVNTVLFYQRKNEIIMPNYLKKDHQQISYEQCIYESVDHKKPLLSFTAITDEKMSYVNSHWLCMTSLDVRCT